MQCSIHKIGSCCSFCILWMRSRIYIPNDDDHHLHLGTAMRAQVSECVCSCGRVPVYRHSNARTPFMTVVFFFSHRLALCAVIFPFWMRCDPDTHRPNTPNTSYIELYDAHSSNKNCIVVIQYTEYTIYILNLNAHVAFQQNRRRKWRRHDMIKTDGCGFYSWCFVFFSFRG